MLFLRPLVGRRHFSGPQRKYTAMHSRFTIERLQARILDIPTIRPHKLSFVYISRQSQFIVQVWLKNGAT